ncbi:unnamed protein product [Peniophora sp. CBMAI 1063]|nr:unnamed protein product [Peniophora sp. CBMAI 1063]
MWIKISKGRRKDACLCTLTMPSAIVHFKGFETSASSSFILAPGSVPYESPVCPSSMIFTRSSTSWRLFEFSEPYLRSTCPPAAPTPPHGKLLTGLAG